MATIDQALADLQQQVGNVGTLVADLRAEIAAGNEDSAQLQAAADAVENMAQALQALQAPPAPAPVPPPAPEPTTPPVPVDPNQPGSPQGGTTTI